MFISVFSLLFMETARELSSVRSLHDVLDEAVEFEEIDLSSNSKIVDRNGNVVSDVYAAENRIYLSYEEIPSKVREAFIAIEDQSFFDHPGFDLTGIARAFLVNVQSQAIEQGGSTITQQLARNLYLSHSQSYERKLTELLYAYHLERLLSKEEILELYMNTVYFANGVYGIEAAAEYYLGSSAAELTLAQTAYLTSIPNNPTHYNPLENPDAADERKKWVLEKMHEMNYADNESYENALEEEISLHTFEKADEFPDYVTYVFHELQELISAEEGFDTKLRAASDSEERSRIRERLQTRTDEVLASGITIETALDPDIQNHAVSALQDRLAPSDIQGAVSIIDHEDAEIVAVTGGTDYRKFDFHRGFQAYRQPGSAIKPLLVYAPLLEEFNMSSSSIIDASPIKRGDYEPENFGGAVYGKVSIEEALKNSYNTAAVRTLDLIGIDEGFGYFNQFDFNGLQTADYSLPAALGGLHSGVTVHEITQAYTAFATGGVYKSPKAIQKVTDTDGNIMYEWPTVNKEVWNPKTVENMRDMMSSVVSDGTGSGASFNTDSYLGGKTGTTNEFHDLWFVGSTDSYTAGLWLGNDTPASLYRESSQNLHTTLWRDVMQGIQ